MATLFKRTKNDPRITPARKKRSASFIRNARRRMSGGGRSPWKANLTKKAIPWHRLILPVLALAIPVIIVFAANNLVLRLPDLYNYHLLNTRILDERMISADEGDVANLISEYLTGRADRFQMKEDLEYLPAELFTVADGEMMARYKAALDIEAAAAAACFVLSAALTGILIRIRKRDLILRAFAFGVPVYVAGVLANGIAFVSGSLREAVYGISPLPVEGADELLPALLPDRFFQLAGVAGTAASLIFLGLVYYLVLMLSGRKTIFRR